MARSLQFHFLRRKYNFTFKIGFFSLCLFFVCLFYVLGVWQLHRYHFKKTLLADFQQRLVTAPIPFEKLSGDMDSWQFQNVTVRGHYVNESTMLLQNQFNQNHIGFDVITPFQIANEKKLLLIDRGWVEQSQGGTLPKIDAIQGEQQITGYIKIYNEHQFTLGKNILYPSQIPLVMQKVDTNELTQITHQNYFPFVLRLNAAEKNGYKRDWPITTVMPERHMGYAVQWFAMAIVLIIAFLCFCCERVRDE